jgi:hypothetical protein
MRPMGEAEFETELGTVSIQATCEQGDLPPGATVRVVHFRDGLATVRLVSDEPNRA